jgi:hypothetical protein
MFNNSLLFMPPHVRETCPQPWHPYIKIATTHKYVYAIHSYEIKDLCIGLGEGGHIYLKTAEAALSISQLDDTK